MVFLYVIEHVFQLVRLIVLVIQSKLTHAIQELVVLVCIPILTTYIDEFFSFSAPAPWNSGK
jgi:hypothetical protein